MRLSIVLDRPPDKVLGKGVFPSPVGNILIFCGLQMQLVHASDPHTFDWECTPPPPSDRFLRTCSTEVLLCKIFNS